MLSDRMTILGTEITRGKGAFLEMKIAKLHTRNHISVPVLVNRATKPGPTVLILGGVHGDEINGVAIVREIIRRKLHKPKRGTIICIPVLNSFGYLNQSRDFPDGRDLNRMFPGASNGSLASQFAYHFMKEIVPHVDYALDFHTGGAARENFPNVRFNTNSEKSRELAEIFGAPFMVHSNYIPKSLRAAFHKLGIPIILFEGGKSLHLDPEIVTLGVQGALNIMKHLGIHQGNQVVCHTPVLIRKSRWIRAPFSGLFESFIMNGSYVQAKTLLGRISDPYGEFERKIYATGNGFIFGLNTSPIVNKGDAIFHISTE